MNQFLGMFIRGVFVDNYSMLMKRIRDADSDDLIEVGRAIVNAHEDGLVDDDDLAFLQNAWISRLQVK